MKTKIVYVLVSNEQDIYLEQTLLSVYSARFHMPDVEIILLVDDLTERTINGKRSKILDYITSKTVVEVDGKYTNQQRSRILKTSISEYVNGDFLFIDSDTIITMSLEEADSFDFDIGAVIDSQTPTIKGCSGKIKSLFTTLPRCKINANMNYFNSGVIYAKDNQKTKQFFKDWNKYWHLGVSKGINVDQPAFYMANLLNNNIIYELDNLWNCQVCAGLIYLKDSKILHYFSSTKQGLYYDILFEFMDDDLYLDIKKSGDITDRIIRIVKNPLNYITPKCVETMIRQDIFMKTDSVALLQSIYNRSNKLFKFIEFASKCVRNIKHFIFTFRE
jgi:hypothetical protein